MTIWFDMDGTLNTFFEVDNWLPMLRASDPTPYIIAKPRIHFSTLAKMIHQAQANGYRVGVISWLAKNGMPNYNAEVTAAKYAWLARHLPSVKFDEIHITPYGIPKQTFAEDGDIIFDDSVEVRDAWGDGAFDVDNIFGIMKEIIKGD